MIAEVYLTLEDVRKRLGVSRSTVWRWQAEHGLKVMRVGGIVRVKASDLDAFVTHATCTAVRDDAGQGVGEAGGS